MRHRLVIAAAVLVVAGLACSALAVDFGPVLRDVVFENGDGVCYTKGEKGTITMIKYHDDDASGGLTDGDTIYGWETLRPCDVRL